MKTENRYLILVIFSFVFFLSGKAQEPRTCRTNQPFYPEKLRMLPTLPSPCVLDDGTEVMVAHIRDGDFAIVKVTVENGEPRDYRAKQWGKGNQLDRGCDDFPTLAKTGLHSAKELRKTKTIGGKPVGQITADGRPGKLSSEGFLAADEDIISVLADDNKLVKKLGFTHPDMARPLFRVFNLILEHRKAYTEIDRAFPPFDYFYYNGKKINFESGGAKGWQTSIFNDDNLGYYWIRLGRELTKEEESYLDENYSDLTAFRLQKLKSALAEIHTGEMVPYYIMRYGFYEGHTGYRADPIAIAFIFGLKSLPEIDKALNHKLHEYF